MGYELLNDDELMHYGVLGMKWGVRRNLKQLSTANSSGDKNRRNQAVNNLKTHKAKINKKISSLDAKNAKIETKREKLAKTKDTKIAKYETKATKYRYKSTRTLNTLKERKLETKARKMDLKVNKLKQADTKMRVKIENNERMKEVLNTGLKDINTALVDNGRRYING